MTEPAQTTTAGSTASGTRPGPHRLYYPAYGPVQAALGFGLFYVLVDLVTSPLATALAPVVPDLVPAPFTTATALLLWAVLGLSVAAEVRRQLAPNPRTFEDRSSLEAFLARERPEPQLLLGYLALLAVGGVLAAVSWPAFPAAFRDLVVTMASLPAFRPADAGAAVAVVAFLVAFGLAAYCLDRLAIGLVREALYRVRA